MDKNGQDTRFKGGAAADAPAHGGEQTVPVRKEEAASPLVREGNVTHFSEDVKVILIGIIILAIIVLFLMILSIVPLLSGSAVNTTLQKSASSGSSASDLSDPADVAPATPAPSLTPVIISSVPAPAVTTAEERVTSYVTIAPKETYDNGHLQDLHQDIPKPSYDNLFTIYSFNNQEIGTNFPYIIYELKNPPLVLDYDVTLTNITDVKYYEYKIKSNKYEVTKTTIRPCESAFFHVTVRDRVTGEVITDEGVGTIYGSHNPGQIIIRKGGSYLFEFTGQFASVTLSLKVPREGNIV